MSYTTDEMIKIMAIREAANCTIEEAASYYDSEDWKAYTDNEADEAVKEYIEESVWAFTASFLSDFTGLPEEMFTAIQDKCEGANDAIMQCIENADGGFDDFVKQAVSVDGRGHFIAQYDHNEHEIDIDGETYYCYRMN